MNKSEKFLIALGIINPIIYYLNPILLAIIILIEMSIIFKQKEDSEIRFWKMFILSYSYFGISILGIKLYDLVLLIFFPVLIFKRKKVLYKSRINYLLAILTFIIYLTITLIRVQIRGNSIQEYIRYILSFALLIIVLKSFNDFKDISKFGNYVKIISVKVILSGVVLSFLAINNLIAYTYNSFIINVRLHDITKEFRVTSFFSDPNKMSLFLLSLLCIYELYKYYYNQSNNIFDKTNIIIFVGMIISLSRTAILSVISYILLKLIYVKLLKKDKEVQLLLNLTICLLLIFAFFMFKDQLINFVEYIISTITGLLGREDTMSLSTSLMNDSRILSSKFALNTIKDNWVIGLGLETWSTLTYMPPHNTIVTLLQDIGVIGLFLWILIFLKVLKKIPLFILIPMIIIPILTFDLQTYRMLYITLGICMLNFNNIIKEKEDINE